MTSAYTYDPRKLVCLACAASIKVPAAGGSVTCLQCRAKSDHAPRPTYALPVALDKRSPGDEYARYQRLQAQEQRTMTPPPGLERLVVGAEIPTQLVPEALGVWRALLGEVRAGAPMGVHERLLFLTTAISQAMPRTGIDADEVRRRSFIETTLEVLAAPAHRQQLLVLLVGGAARVGDVAASEAWLACCDLESDDLFVDSDVRFAAACVATAKGDFSRALQWLGRRNGDVPIAQPNRWIAGIFRANALERAGDVDAAVAELRALPSNDGVDGLRRSQQIYARFGLCPTAIERLAAERATATASDPDVARGIQRGTSWGLNGIFGIVAVGFLVAGYFADPSATTDDGYDLGNFYYLMGAGLLASNVFTTLLSRGVGRAFGADSEPVDRAGWTTGLARIARVQPTGWTINDLPQLELALEVFVADVPPYQATTKVCVPEHVVPTVAAGVGVRVLVHPTDRAKVALKLD